MKQTVIHGLLALGVIGSLVVVRPAQAGLPAQPPQPEGAPAVTSDTGVEPDPLWLQLVLGETPNEDTGVERALATGLTVSLDLTTRYLAGAVPGPNPVSVTFSRAGRELNTFTVLPILTPSGFHYLTPLGDFYGGPRLQTGDGLRVAQGALSQTVVVPGLAPIADSTTDTITGVAPDGPITLVLAAFGTSTTPAVVTTTVTGGALNADVSSALDLRPRDGGFAVVQVAPEAHVYARFVVPFLRVTTDEAAVVSGMIAPNSEAVITLTRASRPTVVWGFQTGPDGRFRLSPLEFSEFSCPTSDSCDWRVAPGDRVTVSAAGQSVVTQVLDITAQLDSSFGQVVGRAPAGAKVEVSVLSGAFVDWLAPILPDRGAFATTASSGNVFSMPVQVLPGERGAVIVTDVDGHQTTAAFVRPGLQLFLNLGSPWLFRRVSGSVLNVAMATPSQVVTTTITGPSGYPKGQFVRQASTTGYLRAFGPDMIPDGGYLRVEGGDTITLQTASGPPLIWQVPTLTAGYDMQTRTVLGRGLAGATVRVSEASWPSSGDAVIGTVAADGTYEINIAAFVSLAFGGDAQVVMVSPEGYWVSRWISTLPPCPLLTNIDVFGYTFASGASNRPDCQPPARVALYDGSGVLKATSTWFNNGFIDEQSRPVQIVPGDQLIAESREQTQRVTIPPLSLEVDTHTGDIRGNAPAGTLIELTAFNAFDDSLASYRVDRLTVPSSGQYLLAGRATRGTVFTAVVLDRAPTLSVTAAWPYLQVSYSNPRAGDSTFYSGWLAPLEPYTLTVVSGTGRQTIIGLADGRGTVPGFAITPAFTTTLPVIGAGTEITIDSRLFRGRATMPDLSARIDPITRWLTGRAPAGGALRVTGLSAQYGSLSFTADANGEFRQSLTGPLGSLDLLTVTLFDSSGIWPSTFAIRSGWDLSIGGTCFRGTDAPSLAVGQAELISTRVLSDTLVEITSNAAGEYRGCFAHPILSGDRIQSRWPQGARTEITIPILTIWHDPGRQVLEGVTVPNGRLTVSLAEPNEQGAIDISRAVTAGPDGRFGIDVSDIGYSLGDQRTASLTDPAGNRFSLGFVMTGFQHWLPWIGRDARGR